MSKCVYVVKGSEDGDIGVYGSLRKARLEAENYSQGTLDTILKSESEPKGYYWRYIGINTAEIDKWYVQ
jgi:hypothetical protein